MIDYQYYEHVMIMSCDNDICDEQSVFIGTFKESIAEAKEEGWKVFKKNTDEWGHICPFCRLRLDDATEVFK